MSPWPPEAAKKRGKHMKQVKKWTTVLFFIAVAVSLYGGSGKTGYQVDLVSSYIWRGWDAYPVHQPAFQPSVTYEFGGSGFSVNTWFSFSFEKDTRLHEVDLTLEYSLDLSESISLTLGYMHYNWFLTKGFTFRDNTTNEVYVIATFPRMVFNPEIKVYYDYHNGDGIYASLALSHLLKLNRTFNALFSASLGYNDGQWLPDGAETGFSDLNLGIAAPFKIGEVEFIPSLNYTFVFLDDISKTNHFKAGISLVF